MTDDLAAKRGGEVQTAAAVSTPPTASSPDGSDGRPSQAAEQRPAPAAEQRPAPAAGDEAPPAPTAGEGSPTAGEGSPAAGEGSPAAAEAPTAPQEPDAAQEPAAAEEPAAEGELDVAALAAKAARADEYLELAQRTRADFENYRKRAAREAALAQQRGVAKLAKELLAAIDNLDRALAAAEAQSCEGTDGSATCEQLLSGIRLVHADVLAAFARLGIEPFSPVGEPFDPQLHEAVAQQPREGAPPGTVVEVYQLGYRLNDDVLRPARVLVAA
jgi:molecular chaperone GrpE